jgi:hypothetical protein
MQLSKRKTVIVVVCFNLRTSVFTIVSNLSHPRWSQTRYCLLVRARYILPALVLNPEGTIEIPHNAELKLNKSTKWWKNPEIKIVLEYWRFIATLMHHPRKWDNEGCFFRTVFHGEPVAHCYVQSPVVLGDAAVPCCNTKRRDSKVPTLSYKHHSPRTEINGWLLGRWIWGSHSCGYTECCLLGCVVR